MKIKQLNKVITPRFTYRFDLKFMFEDADYYEHEIVEAKADDPNLERFIEFIDKSYRVRFDYDNRPADYDLFCTESDENEDGIFFYWPYDEYQEARLVGSHVTFFDGNGTGYEVDITK
jgi:hypothetical protein